MTCTHKYRAAVAYVAVETPAGDERIGTAFHVGNNTCVTARHAVEGNLVREIATTDVLTLRGDKVADVTAFLATWGSAASARRTAS